MKFDTYAVYIRAIVYYMNYLQARKELDETTASLESLRVQPPAVIANPNNFQTGEQETGLNYTPQIELNMDCGPIQGLNCQKCQSQDVEFDNTIGQAVCMGCGEELNYNPFDLQRLINPEEYEVME